MKIVVKHFPDPEDPRQLADSKVTVQVTIPEEAGGEDVQGPIDLTLGQQLTLEVAASEFEYPGGGIEGCFPAISDTQIQAVLDPAPPLDAALTERGAAVAEKVRRAMAETPQPWNSGHLDRAISEALA